MPLFLFRAFHAETRVIVGAANTVCTVSNQESNPERVPLAARPDSLGHGDGRMAYIGAPQKSRWSR